MTVLRMKGVRVNTLAEFRKNFDFTNAKDYLREGRLSRWVRELGETDLADELDKLNVAVCGDEKLRDIFVGIFGLDPEVVRPPEPADHAPEEEIPFVDGKHDSDAPIVYEGFFPDTPAEPTQENIDRTLRIKATLKIIGEQARLAIPPKIRGLVSASIKITPGTWLDDICPRPEDHRTETETYGLAGALNEACGPTRTGFRYDHWGFGTRGFTFSNVGRLVNFLSTGKHEDILKNYRADELAQLSKEKF